MNPFLYPSLTLTHISSVSMYLSFFVAIVLLVVGRQWLKGGNANHWKGIPGPKRQSWLIGVRQVEPEEEREAEPEALLRQYTEKYGTTFVYPDVMGKEKIYTSDPAAMAFVTSDIETFQMDSTIVAITNLISGGGLVSAFGQPHKRMRRALSPSFSVNQLRKAWEVIGMNAALLSKRMGEAADRYGNEAFNCCPLLESAALDAIAEAGFGYRVGALEDGIEDCLLAKTYTKTVQAAMGGRLSLLLMIGISHLLSPRFVSLPLTSTNRVILAQKNILDKVATNIVDSKKEKFKGLDKETINSELSSEKDILSNIVRHNLVSPPHSALSDQELVGQVQLFLFAGFETTATTFSWCMWHMARDLALQDRLRKEIHANFTDLQVTSVSELTYEQVWDDDKMGLVGRILNETLRMHPPVATIERTAQKATVVPLLNSDRGIVLNKGDNIILGTSSFNFSEKYFGKDVHKFNPDRWLNLPEEHRHASLPQQGSMNFSAGPKSCIGSKFALTELRSFLIELIANHRFEPSSSTVVTRPGLVLRPSVIDADGNAMPAMPLKVTRLQG